MSDLGMAAATLELAQVTIKVLKFGYKIMSDVRNYGKDAEALGLKFSQLTHRYDSLQRVLFQAGKFQFLRGRQLFVELPEQSQNLIRRLFLELLRLVYAHFTLEQKFAKVVETASGDWSDDNHLGLTAAEERLLSQDDANVTQSAIQAPKASSFISASGWLWSLRGKRRASRINEEFEDWLRRTKEILEDCWWPLPFFSISADLKILQLDSDVHNTGLARTAALRRLVIEPSNLPTELKADWQSVHPGATISPGKSIGIFQERPVLIETLTFPLDDHGELPELLDQRFSQIVQLLNAQSDPEFRVLRCLTYASKISESSGQLRLISELPAIRTPAMRVLSDLYHVMKADQRPSLGVRFRMCHQLAQSLYLFHSVDWVHRAFRSDNILFILPSDSLDQASLKTAHLRICGFEASRFESEKSLGPYDNTLARNVYRHPDRWGIPRVTFSQCHDVYALGVVLLEIGLWEKTEDLIVSLKPDQLQPKPVNRLLLRHTNERLAHRCGDIFADAVRRCLTWEFDVHRDPSTSDQQHIHRGLMEQVVDPLRALALAV